MSGGSRGGDGNARRAGGFAAFPEGALARNDLDGWLRDSGCLRLCCVTGSNYMSAMDMLHAGSGHGGGCESGGEEEEDLVEKHRC